MYFLISTPDVVPYILPYILAVALKELVEIVKKSKHDIG